MSTMIIEMYGIWLFIAGMWLATALVFILVFKRIRRGRRRKNPPDLDRIY